MQQSVETRLGDVAHPFRLSSTQTQVPLCHYVVERLAELLDSSARVKLAPYGQDQYPIGPLLLDSHRYSSQASPSLDALDSGLGSAR